MKFAGARLRSCKIYTVELDPHAPLPTILNCIGYNGGYQISATLAPFTFLQEPIRQPPPRNWH